MFPARPIIFDKHSALTNATHGMMDGMLLQYLSWNWKQVKIRIPSVIGLKLIWANVF